MSNFYFLFEFSNLISNRYSYSYENKRIQLLNGQLTCVKRSLSLIKQISNEEIVFNHQKLLFVQVLLTFVKNVSKTIKELTSNLEEIKNETSKRKKEHSQSQQFRFILCFSH
ncbi:hypothetical protein ABPG72_005308 [Tetrahymena utriculariae]